MQRLIDTQRYNTGRRPSGWNVSKAWGRNNGGAIPPNFASADGLEMPLNVLIEANTSSVDPLRKALLEKGTAAHPAMFPWALPDHFIRFLTDEEDVVLDPYCGSNTTGYVADDLGRHWLGIDMNSEYMNSSGLRWS